MNAGKIKNVDFFSEINRAGKDFRMIQNPASDKFVETDSESAAHNEGITLRNYPEKETIAIES